MFQGYEASAQGCSKDKKLLLKDFFKSKSWCNGQLFKKCFNWFVPQVSRETAEKIVHDYDQQQALFIAWLPGKQMDRPCHSSS
jgi:hypothetical protein